MRARTARATGPTDARHLPHRRPARRPRARYPPLCAPRRPERYVLPMAEDPKTEELKIIQLEREQAELERAQATPDEDEAVQHERRADKARYLAEKLEQRAESEREQPD